MIRTCQNPHCKQEFEANKRQIYCTASCREVVKKSLAHKNRKIREARARLGLDKDQLLEWKERIIRTLHHKESVSVIAAKIKKAESVVIRFCQLNRLSYFEGDTLHQPPPKPMRREPPPEPIKRPPAVYSNHTNSYNYYIARLS